jgi:hypothetical protein
MYKSLISNASYALTLLIQAAAVTGRPTVRQMGSIMCLPPNSIRLVQSPLPPPSSSSLARNGTESTLCLFVAHRPATGGGVRRWDARHAPNAAFVDYGCGAAAPSASAAGPRVLDNTLRFNVLRTAPTDIISTPLAGTITDQINSLSVPLSFSLSVSLTLSSARPVDRCLSQCCSRLPKVARCRCPSYAGKRCGGDGDRDASSIRPAVPIIDVAAAAVERRA